MKARTILVGSMLVACFLSGARLAAGDEPDFCSFEFAIVGTQKQVDAFNNDFMSNERYKKFKCKAIPFKDSFSYDNLKGIEEHNAVTIHQCPTPHENLMRVAFASYLEASNASGNLAGFPRDGKITLASANSDLDMLSQASGLASLTVTAGSCAAGCTRGWCLDGYSRCAKDIPTCNKRCN